LAKGLTIKDVRSQGGGVFVPFCGQGKFFRCERPHFLVQKLPIFRNLWRVRTDKGVEPVRTFCGGVDISRFCADVFYGRSLSRKRHSWSIRQNAINYMIITATDITNRSDNSCLNA